MKRKQELTPYQMKIVKALQKGAKPTVFKEENYKIKLVYESGRTICFRHDSMIKAVEYYVKKINDSVNTPKPFSSKRTSIIQNN